MYGSRFRMLQNAERNLTALRAQGEEAAVAGLKDYAATFGPKEAAKLLERIEAGDEGAKITLRELADKHGLDKVRERIDAEAAAIAPEANATFSDGLDAEDELVSKHVEMLGNIPLSRREDARQRAAARTALHGTPPAVALALEDTAAIRGLPANNGDPSRDKDTWDPILAEYSEQRKPPGEYDGLSNAELEKLLPSYDGSGPNETSTPGVLVATETVVDHDLEKSLAQMRRELEDDSPRRSKPSGLVTHDGRRNRY